MGWSATELIDCLEGFAFRSGDDLTVLRERLRRSFGCNDPALCIEYFVADHPDKRHHPLLATINAGTPLPTVRAVLFAIRSEEHPSELQSLMRTSSDTLGSTKRKTY